MLAAYDFYRFNSLEKLIQHWDTVDTDGHIGWSHTATALDILGCGLRLPAGVASPGVVVEPVLSCNVSCAKRGDFFGRKAKSCFLCGVQFFRG